MDDPRSVIPIFQAGEATANVSQTGSGVLIGLGEEVFLLTAAHVTDLLEEGALLVPGRDELIPCKGHLSHVPLSGATARTYDHIDIGYLRLSRETRSGLHQSFAPLSWDDLGIFETLCEGDLYTFVGFPASRARTHAREIESEIFKFTGAAASDYVYSQLGYDPSLHIAIMFDRRRAIVGERIQTAPHPRGLSGGAIFSWSKGARTDPTVERPRRLVGIAHTYREAQRCMIGTRINGYLAAIFKNNPHLARSAQQKRGDAPLVRGIAWYRAEEWSQLQADFEDSDSMHSSWHEWREAAQRTIEQMLLRGVQVIPVEVTAEEISEYCRTVDRPNTSHTRRELVNRRLRESVVASNR